MVQSRKGHTGINPGGCEKEMKKTKQNFEEWLNELEVPFDDRKSNGGRVPDYADYGTWLRRNDPIAFNVGFQEW